MATKDWKKIRSNEWDNKKRKDNLFIRYDSNFGSPYEITYGREGYPKNKRFKTKSQALKFARSYMRRH